MHCACHLRRVRPLPRTASLVFWAPRRPSHGAAYATLRSTGSWPQAFLGHGAAVMSAHPAPVPRCSSEQLPEILALLVAPRAMVKGATKDVRAAKAALLDQALPTEEWEN